jgi:Tfp pilus assembly protein PilW
VIFVEEVRETKFGARKKRLPRRASAGSSLVEMLIAILVLGVVLISMVGMFLISRTAIYNKEDETANALALRYLEEVEVRPYSDFTAETPPFDLHGGSWASPPGNYRATAKVLSADNYSAQVEVSIKWEGAALGAKNLALVRFISAGGHKNVGELN